VENQQNSLQFIIALSKEVLKIKSTKVTDTQNRNIVYRAS